MIPDRAGWRSPVFALPATTTAENDVVSAYLRLHDAPGSTCREHALIRLEARDPETLDAACALAMRTCSPPAPATRDGPYILRECTGPNRS